MTDKMSIEPTRLLDREVSVAMTAPVREFAAPILREVVDEGLAAFERCNASARGSDENIGLLFPFLQLLEMLDGAEVALNGASTATATVILRAAFEALLAVEWVSREKSLRYGAAYVVADIYRRLTGIERYDSSHPKSREFAAVMRADEAGKDIPVPTIPDAAARMSRLTTLLSAPHLVEAAREYERVRKEGVRNPPFFALWNGPRTLEQLSRRLRKGAQYEILYRQWSRTAHAVDLVRQLGSSDGTPAVRPFRSGDNLAQTYSLAIGFGLAGMRMALGHYRPDELTGSFRTWYVERVQRGYQKLVQAR